jgi:hypothetical protein
MNKLKNVALVILTALLALTLLTQPAQSAGKSKEAKTVEYQLCLEMNAKVRSYTETSQVLDSIFLACSKYRP